MTRVVTSSLLCEACVAMSCGSIAKVCHPHSNGEKEYPRQPTIERKCTTRDSNREGD